MEPILRRLLGAQYVGAGDDVLAAVSELSKLTGNAWTVLSVDEKQLVLRETGAALTADWTVRAGDVVVVDPSVGIVDRLTPAAFADRYIRQADLMGAIGAALVSDPKFVTAVAAAVRAVPQPKAAGNVRPEG